MRLTQRPPARQAQPSPLIATARAALRTAARRRPPCSAELTSRACWSPPCCHRADAAPGSPRSKVCVVGFDSASRRTTQRAIAEIPAQATARTRDLLRARAESGQAPPVKPRLETSSPQLLRDPLNAPPVEAVVREKHIERFGTVPRPRSAAIGSGHLFRALLFSGAHASAAEITSSH
jgi:hypothetical protein